MKHRLEVCLAMTTFVASLFAGCLRGAESIRICADTWMPLNGDPASDQPGYVVELLRLIFSKNEIAVDYQIMPWSDALKAAEEGAIDGVIGASRREAAHLVIPEEIVGVARFGLYVRQGNPWTFTGVSSLQGMRLGAIDGYDYWDDLDDYIQAHHAPDVILFTGDTPLKKGLAALASGKIDVMPENGSVFAWAARNEWLQPAAFRLAYVHQGDDACVAFARGNAGRRYARMFDDGIRHLRLTGELARVLAEYGVKDWK